MKNKIYTIIIMTLFLFILGCGNKPQIIGPGSNKTDTSAKIILNVNPGNNSTIDSHTKLTMNFDKPIDLQSLKDSMIIRDKDGHEIIPIFVPKLDMTKSDVGVTISSFPADTSDKEFICEFKNQIQPNNQYTVIFDSSKLKTKDGESFKSFSDDTTVKEVTYKTVATEVPPDKIVLSITPENNSTIDSHTRLTMNFDKPIDLQSLKDSMIIRDKDGHSIIPVFVPKLDIAKSSVGDTSSFPVDTSDKEFICAFKDQLQPNNQYTVTFDSSKLKTKDGESFKSFSDDTTAKEVTYKTGAMDQSNSKKVLLEVYIGRKSDGIILQNSQSFSVPEKYFTLSFDKEIDAKSLNVFFADLSTSPYKKIAAILETTDGVRVDSSSNVFARNFRVYLPDKTGHYTLMVYEKFNGKDDKGAEAELSLQNPTTGYEYFMKGFSYDVLEPEPPVLVPSVTVGDRTIENPTPQIANYDSRMNYQYCMSRQIKKDEWTPWSEWHIYLPQNDKYGLPVYSDSEVKGNFKIRLRQSFDGKHWSDYVSKFFYIVTGIERLSMKYYSKKELDEIVKNKQWEYKGIIYKPYTYL